MSVCTGCYVAVFRRTLQQHAPVSVQARDARRANLYVLNALTTHGPTFGCHCSRPLYDNFIFWPCLRFFFFFLRVWVDFSTQLPVLGSQDIQRFLQVVFQWCGRVPIRVPHDFPTAWDFAGLHTVFQRFSRARILSRRGRRSSSSSHCVQLDT